jgi:hypothetical protein
LTVEEAFSIGEFVDGFAQQSERFPGGRETAWLCRRSKDSRSI